MNKFPAGTLISTPGYVFKHISGPDILVECNNNDKNLVISLGIEMNDNKYPTEEFTMLCVLAQPGIGWIILKWLNEQNLLLYVP